MHVIYNFFFIIFPYHLNPVRWVFNEYDSQMDKEPSLIANSMWLLLL